ncbi:threonine/serine dehydratase [Paraburkholderia hospita]|uniref:threonine/serine dehydratase n=1 Tax=Paraburkholderia hospita TaxID=169430 RepID=UPI0009A8414E|nr:threonine/serine dehydratase [Paraburkholderia hospita]OUL84352.1 serine/threonine dehydratase [Paraburkholderia hospita]SKC96002.1 L-threonine ammonia-lyase [Burkholderia sp. CF099]
MDDLYERILDAHQALRPQVRVTPLEHSALLSEQTGCDVYLKCEHLQHTGSFKFRGASNKLRLLDADVRRHGVATVSTGNHGQGVALAGKLAGVPVTVYASVSASPVKLNAIRALGASVVTIDASTLEVELEAARRAKEAGLPFVSPYNDIDVIAGQGTIGVELGEQLPGLAAVFASVGGGGLISGIGSAIKASSASTEVVGCWPANATTLYRCIQAGKVIDVEETDTISDGTAGGVEPDTITLPIAQRVIDRCVLVSEDEIKAAMKRLAQTDRWMVEGAAGVALASFLQVAPSYRGRAVAVVLCGRNIMLDKFVAAVQ